MRISIDLDGTIADYFKSFELAVNVFYQGLELDITRYDLGIPRDKFVKIHDTMIRTHAFENMSLMKDAEALSLLEKDEVWYITSRQSYNPNDSVRKELNIQLREQTQRWLCRNRFPQSGNLILTSDKGMTCSEFPIHYLVDDDLETVRQAGRLMVRAYLIDRPWNEGSFIRFGEYDYPFRVRTLRQVIEYVRQEENAQTK